MSLFLTLYSPASSQNPADVIHLSTHICNGTFYVGSPRLCVRRHCCSYTTLTHKPFSHSSWRQQSHKEIDLLCIFESLFWLTFTPYSPEGKYCTFHSTTLILAAVISENQVSVNTSLPVVQGFMITEKTLVVKHLQKVCLINRNKTLYSQLYIGCTLQLLDLLLNRTTVMERKGLEESDRRKLIPICVLCFLKAQITKEAY